MTASLERLQVILFAAALGLGVALGLSWPRATGAMEAALWPVLALLLYATFMQVHVRALPLLLRGHRYLGASLIANFVVVPAVVWLLLQAVPLSPGARVGLVLVLLAPCTDWFSSFTHLGRGDTRLAVASIPVLLVLQFALLPAYVWLLAAGDVGALPVAPVVTAFGAVVLLPLVAAGLTQEFAGARLSPAAIGHGIVPLLAAALFLVAGSQAGAIRDEPAEVARAALVAALYLGAAPLVAVGVARSSQLDTGAARTLAFNVGTRNSFVVLPIALALPEAYAIAAPVVAVQTLVEVTGMVAYVRLVPAWLFPDGWPRRPGPGH